MLDHGEGLVLCLLLISGAALRVELVPLGAKLLPPLSPFLCRSKKADINKLQLTIIVNMPWHGNI